MADEKEKSSEKKAEEALKESEEKYRLLIENSGSAVMALDKKGVHLLLNSLAAKNLGGKPDDFIGKSIYDIFPKDLADMSMKRFNNIIKSGVGKTFEDLVNECVLGIIILDGFRPNVLYEYGFLKGRNVIVLPIKDKKANG